MEGHERWWDKIWMEANKKGDIEVTFTPEHGPPNYQVRGHFYSKHCQTSRLEFIFTPEY